MRPGTAGRGGCPACTDELRHCDGVLVRHADGTLECLAPADCADIPDAHDAVYPCDLVIFACGCAGG